MKDAQTDPFSKKKKKKGHENTSFRGYLYLVTVSVLKCKLNVQK